MSALDGVYLTFCGISTKFCSECGFSVICKGSFLWLDGVSVICCSGFCIIAFSLEMLPSARLTVTVGSLMSSGCKG